jgi:hypothetical protein
VQLRRAPTQIALCHCWQLVDTTCPWILKILRLVLEILISINRGFSSHLEQVGLSTLIYSWLMLTDTPFMVTVFPIVNRLSSKLSGSNGGQTLTITGSGFNSVDCSNNVVTVQGIPCSVVKCSDTSISCIVGRSFNQSLGKGPFATSRGLLHRVYWNAGSYDLSTFNSNPLYPSSPGLIQNQADGLIGYCVNCADWYSQQLEGMSPILHFFR